MLVVFSGMEDVRLNITAP